MILIYLYLVSCSCRGGAQEKNDVERFDKIHKRKKNKNKGTPLGIEASVLGSRLAAEGFIQRDLDGKRVSAGPAKWHALGKDHLVSLD